MRSSGSAWGLSGLTPRQTPGDVIPGRYPARVLLSDRDLQGVLESGALTVDPYDPALLQPSSLDVRLDRFFRVFSGHRYEAIDPASEQPALTEMIEVGDGEPFILHPGEFVLGGVFEHTTLDSTIAVRVEGKSSLGRLGLLVHSTAGFIDPGFRGHITLELANVNSLPIKLWPGMKIGQLCAFWLSSPSRSPYGAGIYGSHYQNQPRGPQDAQSWRNFRTWPTREQGDLHA